jgi:hypothetical protein
MSDELVTQKWSEAIARWRKAQATENEHSQRRQQLLDKGIGQKELLAAEVQIHQMEWAMYERLIEEAKANGGKE